MALPTPHNNLPFQSYYPPIYTKENRRFYLLDFQLDTNGQTKLITLLNNLNNFVEQCY